jgi:hypothetical protein
MSEQAGALAERFERTNAELIALVERMSESDWGRLCTAERWSAGVTAHHVAVIHGFFAGLVRSLAEGEGVPPYTLDDFHRLNAAHARDHAACSRDETVGLLRREGTATAALVRVLTDEQLARSGPATFLGGQTITTAALVEAVLTGHVEGHMASIEGALAATA